MIERDAIDWTAYVHQTEGAVKVRAASVFADELIAEFQPPKRAGLQPQMFSTKLRDRLVFRPGELTAWAGYNGHRKSMFTGQVALDLCFTKQRTLVMSFEMTPARTLARMARQCFAKERPTDPELKRFSEWTDGRLWLFDHQGRISPEQCIAIVRYFAAELGGQQVIIDSMMMVCSSEEDLDQQKQLVTDLVRVAQELSLHVHLVAHCRKPASGSEDKPPTKYDLRGSAAISDQAHNIVLVWANRAKKDKLESGPYDPKAASDPDAIVTVAKQRNGGFEGSLKLYFNGATFRFSDSDQVVEPYAIGYDSKEATP